MMAMALRWFVVVGFAVDRSKNFKLELFGEIKQRLLSTGSANHSAENYITGIEAISGPMNVFVLKNLRMGYGGKVTMSMPDWIIINKKSQKVSVIKYKTKIDQSAHNKNN